MEGRSDILHHPGESEIHETHILKIYITKSIGETTVTQQKNVQDDI